MSSSSPPGAAALDDAAPPASGAVEAAPAWPDADEAATAASLRPSERAVAQPQPQTQQQTAPLFPPPPTQPIAPATGAVVGSSSSSSSSSSNNNINNNNNNANANGQDGRSNGPPTLLDFLSLSQLRRLATDQPPTEPATYDYTYEDMGAFDEEVDEWFSYQISQWVRLNYAQQHFESRWARFVRRGRGAGEEGHEEHEGHEGHEADEAEADPEHPPAEAEEEPTWDAVDAETQAEFVAGVLRVLEAGKHRERPEAVGCLAYLLLGRWGATAGGAGGAAPDRRRDAGARTVARQRQLDAMQAGAALVGRLGGIPVVWAALRKAFARFWGPDDVQQLPTGLLQDAQDELANLMAVFYVLLQATLSNPLDLAPCYVRLVALDPPVPDFLMGVASRLRWDDSPVIPQGQVFLLLWKALLLVFGGARELLETKRATAESSADEDKDHNLIMASPLDYHAFRHEITSKYPAYVPPRPPLPLDDDNTTILPPPPNHPPRNSGASGILPGPPNNAYGGASILHQPVHIATPAPSPPPSPAAGGKGGKKQNYQTNQNFPFMYPPLDASSNGAGGKGSAALQDALVGRKWEGSDVPSSILEAGELFSTRVRMTRATRQLWEERERFLKFERGWDGDDVPEGKDEDADADEDEDEGEDDADADVDDGGDMDEDLIEELDLSSLTLDEREALGLVKAKKKSRKPTAREAAAASRAAAAAAAAAVAAKQAAHGEHGEPAVDYGPRPDEVSERVKQRLDGLERFYRDALPHLQSLVIVLLKAILMNVAALMAQAPAGPPQHPAAAGMGPNGRGGAFGQPSSNGVGGGGGGAAGPGMEPAELSLDELDAARTREISAKAVSGILLLLLKWLKVSHVLQFEYLTQLLLDCNYVPLLLKLWAHQDVQQLVDTKNERVEASFFYFCNSRADPDRGLASASGGGGSGGDTYDADDSEEDDAAPPAIKRRRSPVVPFRGGVGGGAEVEDAGATDPDDEEAAAAALPITDFNRRTFFALINLLRVMQKICKNKAHRNLMLMHYKSSNILRKTLKVPQPELRLYTLKLFKNQVPYCGRKWRQANMRVITAVYLYCRPELRDAWLAGSDVEGDAQSSLPLEQALRSLTHWFNVRRYPDKMAPEVRVALREEHDFFVRELDKMDMNLDVHDGESVSEWEA